MGLATPTAIMVGTGRGAQLGSIIRGGEILEDTRRVDTVAPAAFGVLTSMTAAGGDGPVVGVRRHQQPAPAAILTDLVIRALRSGP